MWKVVSSAFIVGLLSMLAAGCGTNNPVNPQIAVVQTVAFESSLNLNGADAGTSNNVWVLKTDGSSPIPLTKYTTSGPSDYGLVWSPDGKKLAFASSRALDGSGGLNGPGNQIFNIWVINADGSGAMPLTRLTVSPGQGILGPPAWSPDGTKLAFTSDAALDGSDATNTNGTLNIWTVNANGSAAAIPITKLVVANSLFPVWFPGSGKLAFSSARALDGSDAAGNNNIWVINADGSGATPLTKYAAAGVEAGSPVVSSDGKRIVFASNGALNGSDALDTGNSVNAWTMNADGSSSTPLTRYASGVVVDNLALSPDGTKIAFASNGAVDGSDAMNANSTKNLWLVNADGSAVRPLTKLTYAGLGILSFGWSPDSSSITYASDRAVDGTDAKATISDNVWLQKADDSSAMPLTRLSNASGIWPACKP
jgi:Tol biopolymer transport system component